VIKDVHERTVPMSPANAWELVERVAEPDGVLWPADAWPAIRFDRPLAVGAAGGHGRIRYTCSAVEPGERVEFRFDPALGIDGTHALLVLPGTTPDECVLRHELVGRVRGPRMALAWTIAIHWLHCALIEDLLDRAETAAGRPPARPARWTPWVRLLRKAMARMAEAPAGVVR
jgi:hypothetical protein